MSEQIDEMTYFHKPKGKWGVFDEDPVFGRPRFFDECFENDLNLLDSFFNGARTSGYTEPTESLMTAGQVFSTLLRMQRIVKQETIENAPSQAYRDPKHYEMIMQGEDETLKELLLYGDGSFDGTSTWKIMELAKNYMKDSTYNSITEIDVSLGITCKL
ncbi:MAG: hypothetical protein GOV01_03565 [Candidatus Altiarchaeota archaeon]|nr:hypothetical protein [Candidatus Altiarchaeota archaeon]